ncbi:Asp-tRNA(Asn)/Glu-tRNA(Gln) amidotransferase subunit GatB [Roseivirga sp.]|uniref:Asp-tRNA(Asn)/Glu-tRNA(Gln) amidotransferase subunit GatB n=1 Tax=Roseivirga sp. TaxID=1964215 RepID=UPI003B5299B2
MPDILQQLSDAGYEATIGLEIHVQLNTRSKIFSSDSNEETEESNTHISVISIGHPGTLPVLNKVAVQKAVLMGLACGSDITRNNYFDRKSYFYPDLPKGYQTTQDKTPICVGGSIPLTGEGLLQQTVSLHHIHLEEDAGKSIHDEGDSTLIDLNRAGTPLIEMVTNPCIKGPDEAAACLQEIRRMVRYLGIGNANMEKGELRCDANISIKKKDSEILGSKVEIKNMNSFNHVRRAAFYELERQLALKLNNEVIEVETRTYDPVQGKTYGMRFKETMNDYRYFPCPDLPPLAIEESFIEGLQEASRVQPATFRKKFAEHYQLSDYDINILTEEKETALYFDALCQWVEDKKVAANWMNGPVRALINETNQTLEDLNLSSARLAELIQMVDSGKVVYKTAVQQLLPELLKSNQSATKLAQDLNMMVEEDAGALDAVIREVLVSLPKEVEAYRNGKKKLMGLFMGEVMKRSRGKANPKDVQTALNKALSNL